MHDVRTKFPNRNIYGAGGWGQTHSNFLISIIGPNRHQPKTRIQDCVGARVVGWMRGGPLWDSCLGGRYARRALVEPCLGTVWPCAGSR